ncbi:MAG: hypothetical protein ABI883_01105 [Chthoniobacterales bacterium]
MNPYAKPKEKRVGLNRPRIQHLAPDPEQPQTRADRTAEKQAVTAQRRAIKKSARRHLKTDMLADLESAE